MTVLFRGLLATSALCLAVPAAAQQTLNALVWCDHTDPALLEPFETANNAKVNLREYEGTGTALSLLEQSQPGDWDVLVIDTVDVPRAVDLDILAEMPADALPTTLFPQVQMPEANTRNGKTYAVTEKFGYNTISFNRDKVDVADMGDLSVMFSDKYAGRIAIYDYYLPVIGLVALSLGKETAKLTAEDMPAIKEKLGEMRKVSAQVSDVVSSQTALATGEVDILIGGGEWVTAGLSGEIPALDWVIPSQGAVRWQQSIGVVKDAANPELALKFVQYILSPEGQARLATSSCYWAMPANSEAGAHLDAAQKAALRWEDQAEYLAKSQLYPVPDADLDLLMQDSWVEMLQQ